MNLMTNGCIDEELQLTILHLETAEKRSWVQNVIKKKNIWLGILGMLHDPHLETYHDSSVPRVIVT